MSVEPTDRERALAHWLMGGEDEDGAKEKRLALVLAYYREELMAPFDSMHEDYAALKDRRVAEHLSRLLKTVRGVP